MITVTSFYFFVLVIVGLVVYYAIPKRMQWIVLLSCNIVYYFLAAINYTIIFLVISSTIAYISTVFMERRRIHSASKLPIFLASLMAITLNIAIWFVLKGSSFWVNGSVILNRSCSAFPALRPAPIASALGMGYYTAQVIGYILDVYWENTKPQHNPAKLLLFVCFFPQLTVGPISRYNDLKTIYESHHISYQNICLGAQRILWGLFKKLVICDRVGIIVKGIWTDTATYNGVWPWIAVFLYPLQIYTDFSGCMDIVLGVSELFDIHLKENFRNPFFAKNTQEFWQRWHITLGSWARDYIYYPVLKSRFLVTLGKKMKRRFGARMGKLIPWSLGMGILWFVMGFWHGSTQHIVGVSFWFWIMLVLSELLNPFLSCVIKRAGIKTDVLSWRVFQCARTYTVYAIGAVAFSAVGLRGAIMHYKVLLGSFKSWNPWELFNGTVTNLGVSWQDINLVILGVLFLLVVAILKEKHGSARRWIQKQNIGFRWLIWLMLFFVVLIYGLYGEGYDASTFIYQGF